MGLRESLVTLSEALESQGRRSELALATEGLRVSEEVGSLKAIIQGLRMQVGLWYNSLGLGCLFRNRNLFDFHQLFVPDFVRWFTQRQPSLFDPLYTRIYADSFGFHAI